MPLLRRTLLAAGPLVLVAAGRLGSTYMVFFDFERTDLTPRGQQIVSEAAQGFTRLAAPIGHIYAIGHAENPEDADRQDELSLKRAQVVAAALVNLGFPRDLIAISGVGAHSPLVPAPPGISRQENRYVELWAGDS